MTEMTRMSDEQYVHFIKEATTSLKTSLGWDSLKPKPKVAVVLGSGLGTFTEGLTDKQIVPYAEVTNMPVSSVKGHAGQWVCGKTGQGLPVLASQGRYHLYEGHSPQLITLPIRMMKYMGIEHVILTNAAGSINPNFHPGDFMLLKDHINLSGTSPLFGMNDSELGPRFVDMSEAYDKKINESLIRLCRERHPEIKLHTGVYCYFRGPQYETPAEIRMAGILGADAAGMSTIPACIAARQMDLKVSGITCITNYGSGIGTKPLSHEEVSEMGRKRAPAFGLLVGELLGLIYKSLLQ